MHGLVLYALAANQWYDQLRVATGTKCTALAHEHIHRSRDKKMDAHMVIDKLVHIRRHIAHVEHVNNVVKNAAWHLAWPHVVAGRERVCKDEGRW